MTKTLAANLYKSFVSGHQHGGDDFSFNQEYILHCQLEK